MDRVPFDPYDFFGYLASGLLIVVGMQLVVGFPRVLGQELRFVDSAFLLLAVYIAGQLVATPAKSLFEDFFVDRILGRPNVNLFRTNKPLIRGILFPGFYKSLPEQIKKRVFERSEREGISGTGEALFLHARYRPEILENDKLMRKLDSFISKYGFSRNLSLSSLVVGSGLLWKGLCDPDRVLVTYGIASLFVSVMLFYRYLKFFRQYSYELFNVYAGGV